jgi:NADPH:quinone reductase
MVVHDGKRRQPWVCSIPRRWSRDRLSASDFVEVIKNKSPDGVDLAYVTVGGDVLRNSYRLVKRGSALVSIVEAPDIEEASRLGILATFVFVEPNGAQFQEITWLIEAGIVRPPEITEMNLEEARRAQELSQAGHVRGKLVLKVD